MSALLLALALLAPSPPLPPGTVCYEIFVRSYNDSDGDGIGDLNGLTQKLDYIEGLGARCVWLMPVAESPSYHGYDVTNYYRIEPDYGTNEDFKRFVAEAHRRGIRVLVDLVLNHASSEHPYFQAALRDTASPYRDWFIWSPTPGPRNQYGHDNWHRSPIRDEYYFGFFWKGMPDLNFRHPAVMDEAKRVARFWLLEMGVDGFRLDAVRHLVEDGPIVSNTPGTLAALREFGQYVRSIAPGSFTVGEVWDSTAVLLRYYPDQLDAYFAFEVSDALLDAVRFRSIGRLFPAILRLERAVPGRWASFLRNHDQTRTLTALGGDEAAARLAATLLLTLPGLPFVYYGEEIGMSGDKPDERLRTPMHWSRAPAAGFTRGTPWEALQPDSFTANVAVQASDSGSLLNLHRRLIHLRAANPALHSGDLVPLTTGDSSVAAYLRRAGDGVVLVVANLGTAPVRRVTVSASDSVLRGGDYAARDLLSGAAGPALHVGGDGR
ncbi:MAG: alpha-amylase family glycosyl hydrolase, partial [Gemmatimonadales bacterium]